MVYYNDFDQGEVWVDKFKFHHPITHMGVAHRIYAARMLDRMAARCATEYTARHPPKADWWYADEKAAEAAELDEWLRENDPNEWIQSTTLYRALMDIPEPLPEEDRDDQVPSEGGPLLVDGSVLLCEEVLPGASVGGPAVCPDDRSELEEAPADHRGHAGRG